MDPSDSALDTVDRTLLQTQTSLVELVDSAAGRTMVDDLKTP